MAGASTFIPGLNPQHPHYLPGYSGHCPLLRFSMGQTYGQATAKLLQGAPGLAWPPAHRTLLPPIRPPSFPEVLIGRLPVRRGHERLSSSLVPGYTGFIPQAQFIFAKNCSQAWAEALSEFNQRHRGQGGHGRLEEVKGEKDPEKDQEAKLEVEKDPEPGQKAEQASPYSMDDKDPQKFFMSGELGMVMTNRVGRGTLTHGGPRYPQASPVTCHVHASSSAPASRCSPTWRCRSLGRCVRMGAARVLHAPRCPGSTLKTWAFYLTMGATCQVSGTPSGGSGARHRVCVCVCVCWVGRGDGPWTSDPMIHFYHWEEKETEAVQSGEDQILEGSRNWLRHVWHLCGAGSTGHTLFRTGYKFQFGRTYGHFTQNALGLSTVQKQLLT
ncbi:protein FAM166B isoform X2 [Sorex araneus]|uniref:protein FAM166B isoform X2 n=1 Tax=Sorex araneus TaxID=42254 RepID=UPI0024336FCC|nr:protein FAM166B isoform X2 [Sorex araneus]